MSFLVVNNVLRALTLFWLHNYYQRPNQWALLMIQTSFVYPQTSFDRFRPALGRYTNEDPIVRC